MSWGSGCRSLGVLGFRQLRVQAVGFSASLSSFSAPRGVLEGAGSREANTPEFRNIP